MSETYRELFEEGKQELEAVLPWDAALDARLLLEEVCGTNLQTLLVYPEYAVEDEKASQYRQWIKRRKNREPLAMILGKWDFMGLTFMVTKDTLIPEQDTEVLVETALALRKDEDSVVANKKIPGKYLGKSEDETTFRILDLGTGTGCILLSLVHEWNDAKGIGTDISEEALSCARENAQNLNLSLRTQFLQGDLWDALNGEEKTFHLIVSNPPYIPTSMIPSLEPEVKYGEPRIALDGGEDGLVFYSRILKRALVRLKKYGVILLEAGLDEAKQIQIMMEEAGFKHVFVVPDYEGRDRVVVGRKE